MGDLFRRGGAIFVAGLVSATVSWSSLAQARGEPPARIGRLAFTDGPVSFHDEQQSAWTPAVVNAPLTSGDALWTEPNARSEVSLAGTRIRLAGTTELDVLALDDTQTRLQLPQGRIDVKSTAMDTRQPYQIVTPRGTISLLQQGDYYVEAGSTDGPTRLGVRAGAAQIQSLNGQVLAVRPGEVGEVTGDAAMPQLRTLQTAPPPLPASWAARDRRIVYDQPPQYLSVDVTGYEDLNAYGSWVNDGSYGEVWVPNAVPAGWEPYRTGHWAYVQPWGWTWIDDQPWGFAPYHYGRWANSRGRWVWLPPQREVRPVYAPALVAFVGGIELAAAISNPGRAPVGWFPLGPREAYVPPYTTSREYYQRINRPARIDDRVLEERWDRAQRREAIGVVGQTPLMNQRFATVVPADAFVRSQPVMRAALQVAPQRIAAAPVAPVAAPPAPTASVANHSAQAIQPSALGATPPRAAPNNMPVARTAVADMPTLARPTTVPAPTAPGPRIAATRPAAPITDQSKPALPMLAPRQGAAPPELRGAVTPTPPPPAKPSEPPRLQQASPQPHATPAAPPAPPLPPPAPHGGLQASPAIPQQAKPAEPPKPPLQATVPQHPAAPPQQSQAPPPPPQMASPQHEQSHVLPPPPPPAVPQHPAAQQQSHAPPPPAPHPAPPPQPPTQKAPNQAQAPAPQPQPHPAPPPQAHPAPQQAQHKAEEKK